ncbi:hypothetical protein L3Y34_002171 [Caenorhabditis briggsae]|uniref:Uncharacterized protein n=1 Tax=Caenorhabditis briggsae TaxID=6238 RepID=A0AAE9IS98_CAEBR|nr:hypothetical protein L3Y34_002171 [Caenorhabditis briggsae]
MHIDEEEQKIDQMKLVIRQVPEINDEDRLKELTTKFDELRTLTPPAAECADVITESMLCDDMSDSPRKWMTPDTARRHQEASLWKRQERKEGVVAIAARNRTLAEDITEKGNEVRNGRRPETTEIF